MITLQIERLTPDFLLRDRTARAIAKSIETALTTMCDTVKTSVENATDVTKMPERRLDELAKEYNCLYDYAADVAIKRRWIREAKRNYRTLGTPAGMRRYMNAYLEQVEIEDRNTYNAEPFHFRVTAYDEMTAEKIEWIERTVERCKNVRSTYDGFGVGVLVAIQIRSELQCFVIPSTPCGTRLCGHDAL